jgi:NADP-dependent 3-hydroxy acid dehydrogenase YdfG
VDEFARVSSEAWQINVVGNMHLINLFLPLVLKGKVKKVIALTSGHADLDLINNFEAETSTIYAATKAALNVIIAKFNAQHKKAGVLFVSLSPGVVETGQFDHQCTSNGSCIDIMQSVLISIVSESRTIAKHAGLHGKDHEV